MNRLPSLVRQHIAALRGLLLFTVLAGIIYPVVILGVAQGVFHNQANGSMVSYKGHVVGSSLLCQEFVNAKGDPLVQYFQPRPSNAVNAEVKTDYGCDPGFSAASNLGPNNPNLVQLIKQRQQAYAAPNHVKISQIPADAVTASGSGLGPDISPLNADLRVNRVAAARHASPSAVRALVNRFVQGRALGFLGEPRVDVLTLNITLDPQFRLRPGGVDS